MSSQPPGAPPPLTEQDLAEMNVRLADLDRADSLIDQSIRGGIDMTAQRQKSRELREQLLRLKQSFFPGR